MIYYNTSQEVEIIVTKYCNRNCKHCLYNNTYNINLTKEKIQNHLPYIVKYLKMIPYSQIVLVGGEIGFIEEELLSFIFEIIFPLQTIISTNGEYILNGYYSKYFNKVKKVLVHLDDIPNKLLLNYTENISYGKVFNNKNQIIPFLNNSYDFIIDYLSYDYSLLENKSLSEIYNDYIFLLRNIENKSNITKDCIIDVKNKLSKIHNLDKTRNYCRTHRHIIYIDLEDETIIQCAGRSKNKIKLTEKEFLKSLFPYYSNQQNVYCNSCVPWNIDIDIHNNLKINNLKCIKK